MNIYNHPKCNFITIAEVPYEEIGNIDFDLCQQPTESLETYYARQATKPTILINGGFFNMTNGVTCFNYVNERETISETTNYKWGIGIKNKQLIYGHLDSINASDFVSGYPNLIDGGLPVPISFAKEINYRARRTILGYGSKSIFLITVGAPGLYLEQVQNLLTSLEMTHAINLDGGGSTRMLVEGKLVTEAAWSRPVDNIVAVYTKPVETILYRVQVGAFSKKANADAMKEKIRDLVDIVGAGYKNAYVRSIDDLYKVQVGAFSRKENATKVLEDLKGMSYNGFITTK